MRVWRELPVADNIFQNGSVVSVGNFDGVHLGHRKIFAEMKSQARAYEAQGQAQAQVQEKEQGRKCPLVVLTFDPHPLQVLRPELGLQRIFPLEDQIELLQQFSVDHLLVLPFTHEFSKTTPQKFIDEYICKPFRPKSLVVGYDFAFGISKSGTQEVLREFADQYGFQLTVLPAVEVEGNVVSSRLIRECLRQGDVELATTYLGRPFYLQGEVIHGDHRGRQLGFPTANIPLNNECLLQSGVYLGTATSDAAEDSKKEPQLLKHPCLINLGYRPTAHPEQKTRLLEAHLLNVQPDLYGKFLRIDFARRIRSEMKFASLQALVQQIENDKQVAIKYFNMNSC